MLLPDDDEIYRVDETYLGPPGRWIGPMRYKAIYAWVLLGPMFGFGMRKLGIPFTLLTVGLYVLVVTFLAMWIADHLTSERSAGALLGTLRNEVSAPRVPTRTRRARGPASLAPRGGVGRWHRRRTSANDSN